MSEQLVFDLPVRTALGRGDFFVSPANAMALQALEGWAAWPLGKLILSGPEGAGKTHLARVWAAMAGAEVIAATDLQDADVPRLATSGTVVVEDVPRLAATPAETTLFHLHNMILAEGGRLLLTGRDVPGRWGIALPDLDSRLRGTQLVEIAPPDDALLARLFCKLFADRQLAPPPRVISYLSQHSERSFAGVERVVAEIDRVSLTGKRAITLPLARDVLARLG